jgi:hypothetical protein
MYFMLECLTAITGHRASIDYEPDIPLRDWGVGKRFALPPPTPIIAETTDERKGQLAELIKAPLPLMSKDMAVVLEKAGVTNIDFYEVEIQDEEEGCVHHSHLAFNLIGTIAAADLTKSNYFAEGEVIISADFDSLVIDENKTRGALMFRLAESVNGIVVHESVKNAIEAAGIDTLTFIPPEEWVG